mgnify:CR=1 FL=1
MTPDMPPQQMLHDVVIRRKSSTEYVETVPVPPDEIVISERTRTPSVQDTPFIQHRTHKTLSELRQLGYDVPDDIADDDKGETQEAEGPRGTSRSPDARSNAGTGGRQAEEPRDEQPTGGGKTVALRMGRIGRRQGGRQTAVLRGYVKADGKCTAVRMRALLDSGAEGEFITEALAKRVGAVVEKGEFGTALTAFGAEGPPLNRRVSGATVQFDGTQPRSGLATSFTGRWDFVVAPQLSGGYDIILGTDWLRAFKARLDFHEPCEFELTDARGSTSRHRPEQAPADGDAEADDIGWAQLVAAVGVKEVQRMHIAAVRDKAGQEDAAEASWRAEQAERGARERPDLIMTMAQLEAEAARGVQFTVYPIVTRWVGGDRGAKATVTVAAVTQVASEAAREAPTRAREAPARARTAPEREQVAQTAAAPAAGSGQGALTREDQAFADAAVAKLEQRYKDVFPEKLPDGVQERAGAAPFRIELKPGAQPGGRYGPRMTVENTEAAGKLVEELLREKRIRPSQSPWGSPMFLVDKPDGSKRMVIDYRALNAQTVRNRYPLPRVDELFDRLQGMAYFSKIDLRTGYWQIPVAPEDVAKTAFTSRHGHYEWLVMPMGLTNAPAAFMALMETTFRDALNKFVLCFLDDILIYSRTREEHVGHLEAVLQRLRDSKLYAKRSKCEFFRAEVEFLGHYVGRSGVRMVQGKVAAVEHWPVPTCQKEVEQFIGLAGYYRRFIAGFSKIAAPLTQLCGTLKKAKGGAQRAPPKKRFYWAEEQQEAFDALKAAVANGPCLALPDESKPYVVHTDASGYATGAVLMQQYEEGLRPIAFLSKRMSDAEQRYPVHEQELLAILNALRAWRHYLGGRRFTVLTDHQSLQYVETSAMATPRQLRWAAWLAEFDFAIKYVRGELNGAADALSRGAAGSGRPDGEEERGEALLVTAIGELKPLAVRLVDAARGDEKYQEKLQESDDELQREGLVKAGGLLYKEAGGVVVVPRSEGLRTYLLSAAHDTFFGGHRGTNITAAWLKERVYWANMDVDVAHYVRGCEQCQRNKPDNRGRMGLPLSIEAPERPWDVLCMDFVGPLPRTPAGYDAVMVVIDKLTRYVYYVPISTRATAQDVYMLLNSRVLAERGIPRTILSDRDTRFTSHFWEALWAGLAVELKRSTAFHPQTDGQTERANRTLVEALRSFVDADQRNWDVLLPELQVAANDARCESTGHSPFYMNNGRLRRGKLEAELEADGVAERGAYPGAAAIAEKVHKAGVEARACIEKAQAKQRADSARGRREGEIGRGDLVLLANKNMRLDSGDGRARKLEPLYFGPYEVLEMKGSNAAKLRMPPGCKLSPVFNLDLLKRYVDGRREFPNREVRLDRPPQEIEEDPARGGPAAAQADPIYEVEAIIGARRRGATRHYRVAWKGWPIEQASWLPREELQDCAELVAEFEARVAEQRAGQARVAAVEVQRIEERARQAASWSAGVVARRDNKFPEEPERKYGEPLTQQERARNATLAAARDTVPLETPQPRPPVIDGEVRMGARRCAADTKAKVQCKAMTRHGEYCWVHLAQLRGVRIKASTSPAAGKALYAARDFKKGDVVARYTGDLVPTHGDHGGSAYVLELSEVASIDAARTDTAEGRMVNDARGSGRRNNCRFSCNQAAKTAVLRATRGVRKGEELFVAYGRAFWPGRERGGAEQQADGQPAGRAEAAGPRPAERRAEATGAKADPIEVDAVRTVAGAQAAQATYAAVAAAATGTKAPARRTAVPEAARTSPTAVRAQSGRVNQAGQQRTAADQRRPA